MNATIGNREKEEAFPLPVNYATGIFFLVFFIPLGYTIFANLQSASPAPVIVQANKGLDTTSCYARPAIAKCLKSGCR